MAKTKEKSLMLVLFKELGRAGFKVTTDSFEDKSSSWLEIRGEKILEISFDYEGNHITNIATHEEIIEVVDVVTVDQWQVYS